MNTKKTLMERLNVWKRCRDLEESEDKLWGKIFELVEYNQKVDEVLDVLEFLIDTNEVRKKKIDKLFTKMDELRLRDIEYDLDMEADLDVI
uniref:Uncharacterized protein n=1 Tax=viral metagenome TaxID=1070528 RepID=A0A6M3JQI6_9ZZZZ